MENAPDLLPVVIQAVYQRVSWLADDHPFAAPAIPGLPDYYRVYRERRYDYKIYYRIDGTPPDRLSILTVRHTRERPPRPSTIRRIVP
jgi:hypothetical protein